VKDGSVATTAEQYTDLDRTRFFINGAWAEPAGADQYRALEAATEEPLGAAALGTGADIDAAVGAARAALDSGPWGHSSAAERAEVMHRFADALRARAEVTSALVSRENGMPITLSTKANGVAPADLLRMYADLILERSLEEVRPSASGSTIVRCTPRRPSGTRPRAASPPDCTPWSACCGPRSCCSAVAGSSPRKACG